MATSTLASTRAGVASGVRGAPGEAAGALQAPRPVVAARILVAPGAPRQEEPSEAVSETALAIVPARDTRISEIALRIRPSRSPRLAPSGVVFGNADDAIGVPDAAVAGNSDYLSLFVSASDVEQVTIKSLMRELQLGQAALAHLLISQPPPAPASPRSALTEQLNSLSMSEVAAADDSSGAASGTAAMAAVLVPASVDGGEGAPLISEPAAAPVAGRSVIHLLVHKSAKVAWHQLRDDAFELSISSSDTVDSLLARIEAAVGGAVGRAQLMHNQELLPASSSRPLASYGIGKGSVLQLVPHGPGSPPVRSVGVPMAARALAASSAVAPAVAVAPLASTPELHEHYLRAVEGLAGNQVPRLAPSGTGGSYFMSDAHGTPVAVFKPADEEPLAVNNPKGNSSWDSSEGMRRGSVPGEGAVREVAAYLLDHDGFAGVPPTTLVSALVGPASAAEREQKVGSLQQYVVADGDCEERGVSDFPAHEVHKIAVLDLRLGNTDRNGGNILARKDENGTWKLTPIDHAYCLPSCFDDLTFEWLYWRQSEVPFSDEIRAYIAKLDAEADLALLAAHGIELRPDAQRVFKVLTLLLKKAAARNLTAYQIGSIASRATPSARSPLEKLHTNALQLAGAGGARGGAFWPPNVQEASYWAAMSQLLDEYLEEFLVSGEDMLL